MKFSFIKNKTQLLVLISVCLLIPSCKQEDLTNKVYSNQNQQNTLDGKNERKEEWEKIYFKSIDKKLNSSQISSLKNEEIKNNDLEIRIWVGFDESELKGIILRKENDKWNGIYLPQKSKSTQKIIEIKNPKSGWQNFEKTLKESNFYSIPDITESKDNSYTDARGIVVEIKTSEKYKTFMQNEDVDLKDYPELKSFYSTKLTDICKFIEKELNVPLT